MPASALPHVSLEEFLLKLQHVRQLGDGYRAQCPAHDDSTPSLSVKIGRNGGILAKCRAGCSFVEVARAVGFEPSQLCAPKTERPAKTFPTIVSTYDYRDASGVLRYQVARFEPKDFRQRQPAGAGQWKWTMDGVARIPYRLNELAGQQSVYIAEGEKDVDALWALGCAATTNVGGAGKWRDGETQALKNAGVQRVIVLPDNDGPGRKHADDIAGQMQANGIACSIIALPGLRAHGDVSDWFAQGHQRAELEALSVKPYVVQSTPTAIPILTQDNEAELKSIQARTSVGQAERFAELYGKEFRFNHFRQTWLHYETPCWRTDADKAVYRAATEFARLQQREALEIPNQALKREALTFAARAESPAALKNTIDCATWNLTFSDRGENWDSDPWALAVANGVLNLRTGLLRPGSPDDRITLKCAVAYDASAECPRWWQFLSEIFGCDEELVEFIWRLSGYFLTGLTTERVVPMFYGRGANGKSVFLNVIAALLGDYAFALPFSSLQFQKQEGIPNDLAALVGRRFVTMIEANDGLRLNEAKLKTLSGNDRISARFLHGEFFTFQPVAKFVLAMNHKPVAKDDSPGFWDRIRLVPFLHTFPLGARDETLQARLIDTEGPGILAWMVAGCLRWQTSGLTRPAAIVAATAEYQVDSDQLAEFLSACCDTSNPESLTGAADVQKAYNGWADGRGLNKIERLSATTLGRQLGERFLSKHTMKGRVYSGLEVFSGQLW